MKLHGHCHCGNITLTLDTGCETPSLPARACSCSFCVRHGAVWTASPDGSLRVHVRDTAAVNRYAFGTRTARFHLCSVCGVVAWATSVVDDHEYGIVNVNTLDGVTESMLQRSSVSFDGEAEAARLARRAQHWIPRVVHTAERA
jgi:hypothetical protein